MSLLDQHRRQMIRERDKRLRLSSDAQTISRRLSDKRSRTAKATTESTRRSRQREVDKLERDFLCAEAKVVDQDKVIAALQKKIEKEEAADQKKRDEADARRERDSTRRDYAIARDLEALTETDSPRPSGLRARSPPTLFLDGRRYREQSRSEGVSDEGKGRGR